MHPSKMKKITHAVTLKKNHKKKELDKKRSRYSGEWHDLYQERKDIVEDEKVHCPAFTAPLMNFGETDSKFVEMFADDASYPSIIGAKKNW